MMVNTPTITLQNMPREELLAPGHRMCAGCGEAIAVRLALKAVRGPTIVVSATGCVEVSTTIYPFTSWRLPWCHVAFENAAAVASGIEATIKALEKKGRLKGEKRDLLVFGGDGGTFDIGLQALSGALERRHDFVYICTDNEAYMNTGIQRSGATPMGAATTTSPVPKGKLEWKKNLAEIAAAHHIDYVATASPSMWKDYVTKVRKAIEVDGPAVIHVIAPCPKGWYFPSDKTIRLANLAVQTRMFPIYEIEKGKYTLNANPPKPLPISDYLKVQGRFKHLSADMVSGIQKKVDENWERLASRCAQTTGSV